LSELLTDLKSQSIDITALTGFDADEIRQIMLTKPLDQANGLDYVPKFEVVVECKDETDQKKVYDQMSKEGYSCRVLTL
jgi:hypothetical protein